jgi:LPXTG-motif cell wall-anchored protein
MGKRALIRLAVAAVGGALAFGVAGPALAQATVPLNQSNVSADDPDFDQGFGECTEVPEQDPDEDVWVFVWPGNTDVEDIESLELNFDSDGDGDADQVRDLDDAEPTMGEGTAMLWVTTPEGWLLVDGTSQVGGESPPEMFNLSHTCAAEADDGDDGDDDKDKKKDRDRDRDRRDRDRDDRDRDRGDRDRDDRDRDDDKDDKDDKGLPVTGGQLGGMALLGGGLLTAGLAMLAVRRRRNLSHLLEG